MIQVIQRSNNFIVCMGVLVVVFRWCVQLNKVQAKWKILEPSGTVHFTAGLRHFHASVKFFFVIIVFMPSYTKCEAKDADAFCFSL